MIRIVEAGNERKRHFFNFFNKLFFSRDPNIEGRRDQEIERERKCGLINNDDDVLLCAEGL